MTRRSQGDTTHIRAPNMLEALVVAGFLYEGALQEIIPNCLLNF